MDEHVVQIVEEYRKVLPKSSDNHCIMLSCLLLDKKLWKNTFHDIYFILFLLFLLFLSKYLTWYCHLLSPKQSYLLIEEGKIWSFPVSPLTDTYNTNWLISLNSCGNRTHTHSHDIIMEWNISNLHESSRSAESKAYRCNPQDVETKEQHLVSLVYGEQKNIIIAQTIDKAQISFYLDVVI